jgi:methyl-accepting chemotaxis protein
MTTQAAASEELNVSAQNIVNISNEITESVQQQTEANKDIENAITELSRITGEVEESLRHTHDNRFNMIDAVNKLGKVTIRSLRIMESLKHVQKREKGNL